MKLFYTGPQVNAELLVAMLEKHDIFARQESVDKTAPDDGDLNRETHVFVEETHYERARTLFYTEREDELWLRPTLDNFNSTARTGMSFVVGLLLITFDMEWPIS